MSKDENKISLENCDFNKKKIRLTSPYSLLACELIGIDENDLIYITKDEYFRKNQESQNLTKELQEERYNHYNSRRLKLIEEAKKKRIELIQENNEQYKGTSTLDNTHRKANTNSNYNLNNNYNTKNKHLGYSTFYSPRANMMKKSTSTGMMEITGIGTGVGWGTSTAIKEEREKLKKLKERQEINIKLQIDYECAMEEIRRKNIEKMKLKEEKEEKKRIEKNKQLIEKLRKEEEKEKNRKKKRRRIQS